MSRKLNFANLHSTYLQILTVYYIGLISYTMYLTAMVTAMDDAVGSIVQKLQESGLYEETIILFASDVSTVHSGS